MTRPHPHPKANGQARTDQGRRSFLVKSVAGGVGASLVLHGAPPVRAEFDAACNALASPLEALTSQKDILSSLQSGIYRSTVKEFSAAVEQTTNYSAELCDKVAQLKAALIAQRKGADYERLKALAEIGCTNARQVQNFSSAGKMQVQLANLKVVSEQIRQLAAELLPEGQGVTLSVEATRALREIIILIDRQAVELRQIQTSLSQTRRTTDEFEEATEHIQSLLTAAINKMYEANSAATTVAIVSQAGDELRKLRAKLKEAGLSYAVETADLLVALVTGTQQWLADPPAVNAVANGAALFRQATYHHAPAGSVAPVAAGELSSLIYNFYPPEGIFKYGKCMLLLFQYTALMKKERRTREEIVKLVESGLAHLSITCSMYQGRMCDRNRFVQELTNIILR
jgi:enamine deaminase RidA (YjgF/YER057c/UK114 family)